MNSKKKKKKHCPLEYNKKVNEEADLKYKVEPK
jgi:hypothetical protein